MISIKGIYEPIAAIQIKKAGTENTFQTKTSKLYIIIIRNYLLNALIAFSIGYQIKYSILIN